MKVLFGVVLLAITTMVTCACSNSPEDLYSPVSPTGVTSSTQPQEQQTTTPPTTPTVEVEDACTIIGLSRSAIETTTKCLTMKIYVPADNADYVNLWSPKVNDGVILKKCPVNEWCEYTFKEAGTYKLHLAVEKKKATKGEVYQCDKHHLTVTVKECEEEVKCPEGSFIKFEFQQVEPDDWPFCNPNGMRVVNYRVKTNFREFTVTVPTGTGLGDGCSNGTCFFLPAGKVSFTVPGSATGYYKGKECATSIDTYTVKPCCMETPKPYPDCTYNVETCSWDCPCQPEGERECITQNWDPVTCKWVGECCPVQVCDECERWDPVACACVNDCPCEPTEPAECPEQVWNTTTCEWMGDCPCLPIGEKECPEQVWDPVACKYVGECACVEEACGEFMVWNQDACACEGVDVCHVSNKGTDGNWNIQETQVKFNPGHANHLDPALFCPPDYLGTCTNKYSTTPHPCMIQ